MVEVELLWPYHGCRTRDDLKGQPVTSHKVNELGVAAAAGLICALAAVLLSMLGVPVEPRHVGVAAGVAAAIAATARIAKR